MLPKLSERAHMRCTSNITRFYPERKQAELRQSGGEALNDMLDFIEECTEHLATLKQRIAEGETPCIDRNWPVPGGKVEPKPEPEVIEKIVEVEVVREVENTERLEEMEARLKAAQEALQARPKTVMPDFEPAPKPEPPAEVAELLREGHSMGDAANELARRWAEFANLRQLNQELTPEQLAKEKRLQKALNWFQGDHSIEVV